MGTQVIVNDALEKELQNFKKKYPGLSNLENQIILEKYQEQFVEFVSARQRSPEVNSSEAIRERASKNLVQLAPDWNRRRKLVQVRIKTMIRIYLSKWFWVGLEWHEVILLETLLDKFPVEFNFLEEYPNLFAETTGASHIAMLDIEDSKRSLYSQGTVFLDYLDLLDLLYSEQDFLAIWKLRSVQSLRDFIFKDFTGKEHVGKEGIKKARIRGYRDGKSSPRDRRQTRLARELDQLFWEKKFQEKWDSLEEELNTLSKT